MSYVDTIRDNNDALLLQADGAIDDLKASAPDDIRDGIQQWVDRQAWGLGQLVPNGLVDEGADIVIDVVMFILEQCEDAVAQMREANQWLGSPDTLRAMADILGEIGTAAEGLTIDKSQLPGWMSWDDAPASKSYDGSIDTQSESKARITSAASSIGGALDDHANDIENYYLQLAAIIIGLVMAVLGIVAAILGLIGALPTGGVSLAASIIGVVTAVGGFITAGIGAVQMFLQSTQGTSSKLDALPAEITEWTVPAFAIVQ